MPIVKKIIDERMTDADARTMITPYVGTMFTDAKTQEIKKRQLIDAFKANIPQKIPTLTQYGIIDANALSQPTPDVKTMNGEKYQKVEGGWKRVK